MTAESHGFELPRAIEQFRTRAGDEFMDSSLPLMAVVLGSGLGGLAESIESPTAIRYDSIRGLSASTASGHRGEFLLGRIDSVRVLAMAGRLHAYEGHSIDELTRPMAVMAEMRPSAVVVSCAAGGLNPRFRVGDLVLIDEHIGMLHGQMGAFGADRPSALSPSSNPNLSEAVFGNAFRCGRPTCDNGFAEAASQAAREGGFRLSLGTYLAVSGPNYETRAECRMMKSWGADLVGMSTVPEVALASRAGLRTLAIGVVTNMAIPDSPATAAHEDVLAVSNAAGKNLESVVRAIARSLVHEQENV
ncbi:purine-nucleoside phosphorylase [Rhodopirellula sp. SWK7]|uniref:purine-nucleoside phosphorylase n=1 Tax=Rhodopirellula sp. SWK7 TaxID=595460 RepID=UPI0002BF0263|nr:purine-nucleoside phosphorylase [Rhodopirellula sp. SWK7]EMI40526.1 Inosine guanosine and xanthosine phosphorylase [Rhodopirellula sp. SWK7]